MAICSSHYALLAPVAEGLLSLMFPFVWQGAYIPVMPYNMRDVLEVRRGGGKGVLRGKLEWVVRTIDCVSSYSVVCWFLLCCFCWGFVSCLFPFFARRRRISPHCGKHQ